MDLIMRRSSHGGVKKRLRIAVMSDRQPVISSLEASAASTQQRVQRLQRLSFEGLRRHAEEAARQRDEEALWELVEAHLRQLAADREDTSPSRHTLRAYRRGLHELLLLWPEKDLLSPSRGAGRRYVQLLQSGEREPLLAAEPPRGGRGRTPKPGKLSPATVRLRVAAARALFDALSWAGASEADPFRDMRLGAAEPVSGHSARAYSEFELIELLAAARDEQERVILLLGAHGGLRVSEMLALTWRDVDLRAGELMVADDDGAAGSTVTISPKLGAALLAYRHDLEVAGVERNTVLELRSQYGVFNRLRNICARAEVDFKGVHALRHSAGTRLYRQTGDPLLVQAHLRHAGLDMVRQYASNERRSLSEALESWE